MIGFPFIYTAAGCKPGWRLFSQAVRSAIDF
jgi:hypothetical protein